MKLIKQLHDNRVLSTAKQKTYEDVKFTKGFVQFLESLACNNLISPQYARNAVETGIRWDDQLLCDGIVFETDNNPFVMSEKDWANTITVTGNKQALESFEYLLRLNEVEVGDQSEAHEISLTVEYHPILNPKLWKKEGKQEEYHLYPNVLNALHLIADEFYDFLDIPELVIEDRTITGSSANYNWTENSDIDLHLLVDLESAEEQFGIIIKPYFDAQRKLFNEQHDIKINGIPVEVYVQAIEEDHFSTGIYSIDEEDWVTQPEKKKPDLDFESIKVKSVALMNEIDNLLKGCNKAAPIERMMEKIIKMRKAGLEEAGEFSTENYVYKVLRNEGYIDKLSHCKTNVIDRTISIEDEELLYL